MSRRRPGGACALLLLAGCYSPYVLPSVGFDQTAAMLAPKDPEVAVQSGYQLGTSASPTSSRDGFALPQGSALGTFTLSPSYALLGSAGNGAGELALKIHLPVQAFDLAIQPEAGFSGNWTLQGSNGFIGSGTLSGGADLLASHAVTQTVTVYGGLRALGTISTAGAFNGGLGVGIEWTLGPVLLRPEVAVAQTFGFDGSTQFIAYPHLTLAVRP